MKIHNLDANEEDLTERYRILYNEIWQEGVKAMPGIERVLRSLKEKNIVLALATSNKRSRVDAFFKRFGLEGVFSIIIGSEKITHKKPNPEVYLKTLEKLGLPSEVVIAVEDSDVGLQAAKSAGLRCAVIPTRHTESHDFSRADFKLKSAKELLDLL